MAFRYQQNIAEHLQLCSVPSAWMLTRSQRRLQRLNLMCHTACRLQLLVPASCVHSAAVASHAPAAMISLHMPVSDMKSLISCCQFASRKRMIQLLCQSNMDPVFTELSDRVTELCWRLRMMTTSIVSFTFKAVMLWSEILLWVLGSVEAASCVHCTLIYEKLAAIIAAAVFKN